MAQLSLDALLTEVNKIKKRAMDSSAKMEELQALQERLLELLDRMNEELDFYESYMPGNAVREWVETTGRSILIQHAISACLSSPEYSLPQYRQHLQYMIQNASNDLIRYSYGSGGQILIDINMYHIGTLDDWAEGVKAYREEIGYGEDGPKTYKTRKDWKGGNKSPDRTKQQKTGAERSAGWARVYASNEARFGRVITHRIPYANGAGFWQILDAGTASVKLSSDLKGGYPTPITPPTRFVDRAKRDIRAQAEEKYQRWQDENESQARNVRHYVNQIQEGIDKLSGIFDTVLNQTYEEFDKKINIIYEDVKRRSNSVENAIKRISEEHSLNKPTEAEKRQFITIGYTAEGKRKRTRVSTLKLRLLLGK